MKHMMTRKTIKTKILLFLVIQNVFFGNTIFAEIGNGADVLALQGNIVHEQALVRARMQDVLYKINVDHEQEDDEAMQELWLVVSSFYKKAFEASAMYLSGYYDVLFDKLMLDLTKDLLLVGKILVQYVPKMLNNPHLSWRIKMKKAMYAVGLFSITLLWIQEMRKHKQSDRVPSDPSNGSFLQRENYANSFIRSV